VLDHLGGADLKKPNHTCADDALTALQPVVRDLVFNHTDLALHFVYSPRKLPGASAFNATELGKRVQALRGDFGVATGSGAFDQFMDNHIGLVVSSLDPYVARWQRARVPYVCRTWCCAAPMPQYPAACPAYSLNRTGGCEVGCYVEVPHGIIVELQCGIGLDFNSSLSCLTRAQPEIFDLCAAG
jgi:hypothetical protein